MPRTRFKAVAYPAESFNILKDAVSGIAYSCTFKKAVLWAEQIYRELDQHVSGEALEPVKMTRNYLNLLHIEAQEIRQQLSPGCGSRDAFSVVIFTAPEYLKTLSQY